MDISRQQRADKIAEMLDAVMNAAQRRHVRIAPMPGQHRQHHRAEYVALARRVRARVTQRAIRHEAVEQSALLGFRHVGETT